MDGDEIMGYAFISYSTKNQSAADAMRALFNKHEIDTWMAPYDIPAGSEYAEVLYDALSKCSCLVLMLTDVSQNSQWVRKEVNIAITSGKTIIPVKLEDIELNSMLKFYLNDQQIVPVHVIDDNSAEKKEEAYVSHINSESDILEIPCGEKGVDQNDDYKIDAKSKEINDDEKIEIFKEVLKRPKVLSGIVLIVVLMIFVFSADAWQQYRFETANRAYTMMEKQEYAEAAELMEQYLDVSWTPYWKMMELVNGKNNKFSKTEAEAALAKCREMITEE